MEQPQLTFETADDAPTGFPAQSTVRRRDAFISFLDEVTERVRAATRRGRTSGPADAEARAALRHTVRNAQMIAARARRAVEALSAPDLELLRAHGRLVAATREAHEVRVEAELGDGTRIFRTDGNRGSSLLNAETSPD